jgi:hypothetical protein
VYGALLPARQRRIAEIKKKNVACVSGIIVCSNISRSKDSHLIAIVRILPHIAAAGWYASSTSLYGKTTLAKAVLACLGLKLAYCGCAHPRARYDLGVEEPEFVAVRCILFTCILRKQNM